MLVKEAEPGEVLVAYGWDVATFRKPASETCAFLIPHGMNHKAAVEMGHSITLLYVGPTRIRFGNPNDKDATLPTRKMHSFLTDSGSLVALEGYEFRHLHRLSSVK